MDLFVFAAWTGSLLEEKGFPPELSTSAALEYWIHSDYFFPISVTVNLWFLLGQLKLGWESWAEGDPCHTPSSLLGLSLLRAGSALRSLVSPQLFSWWEWLLNDIQNSCKLWEVWLKLFASLPWWERCGRIKMCLCDKELWEWVLQFNSTNHDTGSIFIKR